MGALLGTLISAARARADLRLQDVADRVGVSYPAVQQWGKGKTNPTRENLPRLAAAIGVHPYILDEALSIDLRHPNQPNVAEILKDEAVSAELLKLISTDASGFEPTLRKISSIAPKWDPNDPPIETIIQNERQKLQKNLSARVAEIAENKEIYVRVLQHVPVMGIVFAGPSHSGEFYFNGEVADYVERPKGLMYARNAYCVYVVTDSMYPKFEPNELIYVNPDRPAVPNDYVVIEMRPQIDGQAGPGYLKRLVRRGSQAVTVEQFNPASTFELETEEIKAIHRVVPWQELL